MWRGWSATADQRKVYITLRTVGGAMVLDIEVHYA